MKFTLLPLLATALLLQHATPANAAALCIPGIYCPQHDPSPVPVPQCTCSEGSASSATHSISSTPISIPKPSSSTTAWTPPSPSSVVPKPTATWSPPTPTVVSKSTTTWSPPTSTVIPKPSTTWSPPTNPKPSTSVVEQPSTTTRVVPTKPTVSVSSTPGASKPVDSSSVGGPTVTTTITVTGTPQPTGSTCSTGPVQCCNSVTSSDSHEASSMLGLLGIVLQGLNVPVGMNCAPINVLGLGSAGSCNAQTVCCENNNFNGLINIGCSPINIVL